MREIRDIKKYIYIYFFYIISNTFFINIYLPYFKTESILINTTPYYDSIIIINKISLTIYTLFILNYILFSKQKNLCSLLLGITYTTYVINNLSNSDYTLIEYQISRGLMWCFTTPIMINMYSNINQSSELSDNKLLYLNTIPMVINVFIAPFRNTLIYDIFFICGIVPIGGFIYEIHYLHITKMKTIVKFLWLMFSIIGSCEYLKIISIYEANFIFLITDLLAKVMMNFVSYSLIEEKFENTHTIDLQSFNFISYLIKNINTYKKTNTHISDICDKLIHHISTDISNIIPENKLVIKEELLKKILPFNFDESYMYINTDKNNNKKYTNMFVLFTDIVSYTELANKFNETTIFTLLNEIYIRFDTIILKYKYLQKIETIGDAYMIVGDLYEKTTEVDEIVKELIEVSLEFIKEVKNIITPDKSKLSLRIGINYGPVIVGILGSELPRLCVVGNTVNIASRLQSTADPDTIQMDEHVYEISKHINYSEPIEYIYKENIFLKNIGSVNTYSIVYK